MASTTDQASSTKLSEETKQKLLELQTHLQEQQSNSENGNYIKFKKDMTAIRVLCKRNNR
jgi:hypothetical protein